MNGQTKPNYTTRSIITIIISCAVAFVIAFALSVPAFSEEPETFCGKEEHKHTSDCYTMVLTCELEEQEAHTHTDECYETVETQLEVGTETVLICGLEETPSQEAVYDEEGNLVSEAVEGHTHTEACYQTIPVYETVTEQVLVCGLEETEGHVHTKDCYTKKLTCNKKPHKHDKNCYIDRNADVEGPADWEATLPDHLTGVWADDVISVAESQLGYAESTKNYLPGAGRNFGYSRYGAWYGNAYGDWCAMYVSFCLHYAGIPADKFPYDAYCPTWVSTLKAKKMFGEARGKKAYTPKKGDVIFFDWESDGVVDHVGLVVEVNKKENTVRTIEGNSGDVVQYCSYRLDSSEIVGYGKLPINPDDPTVKAKAEADKAKPATEQASNDANGNAQPSAQASQGNAATTAPKATTAEPAKKQENGEADADKDIREEAKADTEAAITIIAPKKDDADVQSVNVVEEAPTFANGQADAQERYEAAQSGEAEPVAAPNADAVPEEVEGDAQRVTVTNFFGIAMGLN